MPGPDSGGTSPSADIAATQLRCSPGWGWLYGHSLKVAPRGKVVQDLTFSFFTIPFTGKEADLGLNQLNSLTQPTNLLEGKCAPGPDNARKAALMSTHG